MSAKIKQYFISVFMIIYYMTIIEWIFARFILRHNMLPDKYVYSNRLPNYRGGFIRRGLGGEIIFKLSSLLNLSPFFITVLTSIITFTLITCIYVYLFKKNRYPLFILSLPFFLGEIVFVDHYVRQDTLLILIFMVTLYIFKKEKLCLFSFFSMNLLLIFGIMIHEAIFFFAFPILCFCLFHKTNSFFKSIFFFLPAIISFTLCFILPEKSAAEKMLAMTPEIKPEHVSLLFYSFSENFSLLWDKANNPSFIVTIAYLILLVTSVFFVSVNFNKLSFNQTKPVRPIDTGFLSQILLFQFFSTTPLFCSAWDWGRWIFLWVASSFAFFLIADKNPFSGKFFSKLDLSRNKWFVTAGNNTILVFFVAILIDNQFMLPIKIGSFEFSPISIIIKTAIETVGYILPRFH